MVNRLIVLAVSGLLAKTRYLISGDCIRRLETGQGVSVSPLVANEDDDEHDHGDDDFSRRAYYNQKSTYKISVASLYPGSPAKVEADHTAHCRCRERHRSLEKLHVPSIPPTRKIFKLKS